MRKPKHKLDIKNYTKNAAKNFSMSKLATFTVLSIVLTIMLIISTINQQYTGKALMFCIIVIVLIGGYSILNIISLITKLKNR